MHWNFIANLNCSLKFIARLLKQKLKHCNLAGSNKWLTCEIRQIASIKGITKVFYEAFFADLISSDGNLTCCAHEFESFVFSMFIGASFKGEQ